MVRLESVLKEIEPKLAKGLIPRTGDDGKLVDLYSVVFYFEGSPLYLLERIDGNKLILKAWDDRLFSLDASSTFEMMEKLDIRIDHYHGLASHTYWSIRDYVFNEKTRLYKLKSLYILSKYHVPQLLFNRKKLQFPHRMKLLDTLINFQLNKPSKSFSSHEIMTQLYSPRWYLHPKGKASRKRMDLYLNSFVSSDELIIIDRGNYKVTGKAIATLEIYQMESAREKRTQTTQTALVILTLLLAIIGIIQSGILKVPTLLDFTKF
ncbi:hypothetical protein ACED23_25625 [Vibrio splendidus]|uniref:Uncharacterized protein n=1 Tax=Vibrio splendidus TaxID=29497 RepID=A0ABV4M0B4_VIBSP